ncbi:MAG: hypothetical protein A4E20_04820 [Nitrospira sp. SG-bin2]|uniref:hypothetical protein n=1 Tax=Nitrospira cf. moscoviensis SBR1015 TaxID=96242 RepID=UPI000A0D3521|nr:hypothetical protein [Nitrospira cf. moscoviensis SBR1015]OQW38100.1 MAG: hypothetical protein A4E20_04820 [Nitrospira sp. SG-bin2]
MPAFVDLAGQKFGRLTPIQRIGTDRFGSALWLCKCDCGADAAASSQNMRAGNTSSCGCYLNEKISALGRSKRKHYAKGTPEYTCWKAIRYRCLNPSAKAYPRYGGRGIKVCERWSDFKNFLADMGTHPGSGYSLDRINPDGDYEPSNCRWSNWKEQQNNRTNNRIITFNGRSMTVSQWSEELGFKAGTLLNRIQRLGWPIEKALTVPAPCTP